MKDDKTNKSLEDDATRDSERLCIIGIGVRCTGSINVKPVVRNRNSVIISPRL